MDDEITGMFQVAKILDALDEPARARVLRWAADKYDIDLAARSLRRRTRRTSSPATR